MARHDLEITTDPVMSGEMIVYDQDILELTKRLKHSVLFLCSLTFSPVPCAFLVDFSFWHCIRTTWSIIMREDAMSFAPAP